MYNNQKIIVVMPAYNAAKTLAKTVLEVPAIVDEIILIDDKSSDETVILGRNLGLTVFEHPNFAFGLLWYLLFLLPSLINPEPKTSYYFLEHRLYLPFIGLLIIISQVRFLKELNYLPSPSGLWISVVDVSPIFYIVRSSFAGF